ncbi:thermonuclease family protein [Agrobacterium tumefaciens]|uniref:thermonuclease family protein n=1 Tax=Agrobacterium tumefaciens TaxID=358 RepID=UPI003D7B3EEE
MDRDRYRRVVAECFRTDGANVNAWMVRNGHAVDWVRYSKGRYSGEQAEAKREALGVWSGQFEMPCAHRAIKNGSGAKLLGNPLPVSRLWLRACRQIAQGKASGFSCPGT